MLCVGRTLLSADVDSDVDLDFELDLELDLDLDFDRSRQQQLISQPDPKSKAADKSVRPTPN